jgi:hypothetical protein
VTSWLAECSPRAQLRLSPRRSSSWLTTRRPDRTTCSCDPGRKRLGCCGDRDRGCVRTRGRRRVSCPARGTSYENVAGQGVTARGSLRKPGQDSRSRASYGTPQVSLLGASSIGWSNDKLAVSVERSPLEKGPTPPTTNRDSVTFHRDYIPPPQRPRRSALAESGQHGGVDPNFPAYSRRTQRHPIRTTRFRSSQACDPKL